jgi:hypothetical protein
MPVPTATKEEIVPERRPYGPRGAALNLMRQRAPEVLLSGPAGTGKTRAVLEKLHLCAEKYPGMRGLICRKTRVSLTESALVTWEQHVVPEGHAILAGASRATRKSYCYPNGSVVVVGGLDLATRIMSTEYDFVYVQEAIELVEDEWEVLTTRLRHGKMPYQQLVGDTNPDRPTHWLKKRCDAGRVVMLESRHEDNPVLHDGQGWTEYGLVYLAKLDALTGPRKLRLRHGRWVQAEGVVYEGWDPAIHVLDRVLVQDSWPRFWSIDFGYVHPFVCGFWARDNDGRLYLYREIYRTKRLVEDHARHILALAELDQRPRAICCDHDAEDRATLERHLKMATTAARKDVSPGIQAVATRLKPAGDGRPRLFVARNALVERDPELAEAKLPCSTLEEFDGYVWDTGGGRNKGEQPIKENDHGMDQTRYLVSHLDPRGQTATVKPLSLGGVGLPPFR